MSKELIVIIPVYNEERLIIGVLEKWCNELNRLMIDYEIHIYDDGSKDQTLNVLQQYVTQTTSNARIIIHHQDNCGHGPTILRGYQENINNCQWIFQIDSDDEMEPEFFYRLWDKRQDYDFLLGQRVSKKQQRPLSRSLISLISRKVVNICYGKGVYDVNAPYRLMRSDCFNTVVTKISATTFAPNLIISGWVARNKLRFMETKIPYRRRQIGHSSIKKWRLFKAATKSFIQTIKFSYGPSDL
ncbi:MAG: glycosyltransferase family 2 protein [Oligoflexia bacterium]|nr:glycosyltransferase family 2 protein [Oligoflexia bacterium]